MRVYICFDRYERDEWYNVFFIETDKSESIRKCKEETLPDFLNYGPDDCHSFQLVEVEMTKRGYNQLMRWFNDPTQSLENYSSNNSDYFNFMCELYDLTGCPENQGMILIGTDGCSDYTEIVRYYSVFYKNRDLEDVSDFEWVFSDEYDEYYEELTSDDELCEKVIKEYIQDTY